MLAGPAVAQQASLGITGSIANGTVIEEMSCADNVINVQLRQARSQPTTVHVFAITRSGPGRLAPDFDVNIISNGGPVIIPQNSIAPVNTGICWRNDIIEGNPSEVEVVIANGPGYTVHPREGRFNFSIFDMDNCSTPADTPGGVVWKENPDCRCSTESLNDEVRRYSRRETTVTHRGVTTTHTQEDQWYHQTLRNLAGQFSDPSYLYCPESPWRGLP